MNRKPLLGIVAACLITGCGGSSGGDQPPPVQNIDNGVGRIDTVMKSVLSEHNPPGISVAVVYEGRLVFAEAYGAEDIARSKVLHPDHRFRVASVSKPITGIALLKAVEEGLVDLDSAAFDILSDFLPATGADPRIGNITVRQLANHTSGWNLYSYPTDPLFRTLEVSQDMGVPMPPDSQALVRWIATQPLAANPGTAVAYTNIAYVTLGRIIEQQTGYSYEDFVQRFVMEPAGVTSAALGGIGRSERLPNEVEYESFANDIWNSVYDGVSDVAEPAYGGLNLLGFDASSAWVISAVDLARLAAAVDGDPTYPDVLSSESIDTMTTVSTPAGETRIGVSWFLGTSAAGDVVAWDHAGGMPGTISYFGRTRSGAFVAVISNGDRGQDFFNDLAVGLVDAVDGISDWPETDLFPLFDP